MKILIIQTAFIGDVILATSLIESLALEYEDGKIDFLVRKGNEGLLANNPHIDDLLIWDKKNEKYRNLLKLGKEIRKRKYDIVLNLQRFASTGFLVWRSKAGQKIGYKKNPLSFIYSKKVVHEIGNGEHEIERNYKLIDSIVKNRVQKPKLYSGETEVKKVESIIHGESYVVIAPASIWYTKQLPLEKWVELIGNIGVTKKIFLIGAGSDLDYITEIVKRCENNNISVLAGDLSLLESAELMKKAEMNYVNDSGPLHIASAVNAPVTAFFCSTIPEFGFGPLSDNSKIIQVTEKLKCRPCGLHGYKSCPEKHFNCGRNIDVTIKA